MKRSYRIGKLSLLLTTLLAPLGCAQTRGAHDALTSADIARAKQRIRSTTAAAMRDADQAQHDTASTVKRGKSHDALDDAPREAHAVRLVSDAQPAPEPSADRAEELDGSSRPPESALRADKELVSQDPIGNLPEPLDDETRGNAARRDELMLENVIDSVYANYPMLRSAIMSRSIAQGDLLAALGEFDLKLKADTLNMPLGYYENYRHSLGAEQPLFGGGSVFGGYRLGRGTFPIYYGERETNEGGVFKAGISVPLAQNRRIDDRRAGVWRNRWQVASVEPEIQAQLIEFLRVASIQYWSWVAAGQNLQIANALLENATIRNEALQTRVGRGDAPEIELTDNERLIVSRRTKAIDARRKFQQSAYKLSLFLRDGNGQPVVVDESRLPIEFPASADPSTYVSETDIELALANRPELRSLSILQEQLAIDLAAARNLACPQFDAVLVTSQDVGGAADPKKDDKQPLEVEGGFVGSVPLQRRKAAGKQSAVQGKIAQVRAKTQFTRNKIVAEVQSANAALVAAYEQLELAKRSLELARRMEQAERRKFDLGESNLLLVNLREQATADAAATEVEAHLAYFEAQADYRAALAIDAGI